MQMLWRCSVLVGLWGVVRVEAQDTPVAQSPIFELHFDEDSLRVVHNEISRALSTEAEEDLASARTKAVDQAPSAPHFPFSAVANNWAKKIVWFNSDGTIKAQRSIPEGRKALVSDNGAYVLLVDGTGYAYEAGSQSVELLDAQGTLLWEARLAPNAFLSPTGETVVSLNIEASKDIPFSVWGPQGKLAEYDTRAEKASFSADGRFLVASEIVRQGFTTSPCLSLFDQQGQRLWQRHCRPHAEHISKVFISESGRFMAFTYYRWSSWEPASETPPPPTPRYLTVLNQNGDILWTRPGLVYEFAFSEEEELIATLQEIEGSSSEEQEIVVSNVGTGEVHHRFPVPPRGGMSFQWKLSWVKNQHLLFSYDLHTSDGRIGRVQLFDSRDVLLWDGTLRPEIPSFNSIPTKLSRGQFLGASVGRAFKVFDLTQIESRKD